jgi:ribosome biogenesis GTPase
VSSLEHLGWNGFFQNQITTALADLRLARIVEEQRGRYSVAGDFEGWAEVSGRFRHEATSTADFPAVGDWVACAAGDAADRAVIHHRFERRTTVSRKAAGRAVDEQVIAANVDTIFLVTALAEDLSPRRLERYLTMVWDAGALPVVVLNKADLSDDPAAAVLALRERLPFVDVIAVSAVQANGLDHLTPYLTPATSIALLGSSGVGKSTIVNRLLGHDRLAVGAVREDDGRGRHTTTARQLIALEGGALLIDTPGMRELQPWVGESAVDGAFEDIARVGQACRFSDCSHESEPGCAVRDAIQGGSLDASRLEHYRHLRREAAYETRKHDRLAAEEEKRKWKRIHVAMRAMYRERDRD